MKYYKITDAYGLAPKEIDELIIRNREVIGIESYGDRLVIRSKGEKGTYRRLTYKLEMEEPI